jgi:uncharacterized protein (UPF0548 family)
MFTYAEVGATRHEPLPPGYHHLRYRTRVGDDFAAAADAVLTYRMHRASGARIESSGERAAPGVRVGVSLGPMRAPCEVIWAVDEPDRAGFGYGTLPGHPESGEESFLVERDSQGQVWFSVTAFSRPRAWYAKLAGPLVPIFQNLYARRLGATLRRLS